MCSRSKGYSAKALKKKEEIVHEMGAGKINKFEITKKHCIPKTMLSTCIKNKQLRRHMQLKLAPAVAKDFGLLNYPKLEYSTQWSLL